MSTATGRVGALARLAGLGGWLLVFNLAAIIVWGHGPWVFAALISAAIGLWWWPTKSRRLAASSAPADPAGDRLRRRLLVGFLIFVLAIQAHQAWLGFDESSGFLVDIALNTDCATEAWIDGRNPWASRCQLWHDIPPTLDAVEVSADGAVSMHGLRYRYGYPYFPAMAATYLPMRLLIDDPTAVRWTNLVLVLAHLVLIPLVLRRLVPAAERTTAILVAGVAWLGVGRLGRELFEYAVTDIAISFWALLAVLACTARRYVTGGVLFGIASGCKLLPGPLLVLPLLLALWHRGDRGAARRLGAAWAVTTAIVIVPALLADPESFVTATLLFYVTYHAVGDDTSLWFFLPQSIQPIVSFLGYVSTAGVIVAASRRLDRPAVIAGIDGAFLGYLVFMAFARMTHLNYLVSIFAFGAVALAWASVWRGASTEQ